MLFFKQNYNKFTSNNQCLVAIECLVAPRLYVILLFDSCIGWNYLEQEWRTEIYNSVRSKWVENTHMDVKQRKPAIYT